MSEFGVGREVQKFDRLRQQQQRRRRKQCITGKRNDSADRAGIGWLLVGVGSRGPLLLGSFAFRISGDEVLSVGEIGPGQAGLNRLRGLRGIPVKMPERQRKLDDQRE